MSAELERVIAETRGNDENVTNVGHPTMGPTLSAERGLPWNRSTRLVLSVVALAVVIAIATWLSHRPVASSTVRSIATPVPVVLATVERATLSDYLDGIGTVKASASATVRARVDGQLHRVHFVEGQDVKAGETLAQIDPAGLQAQLKLAEAQLLRDQAALANARADLKRYSDLVQVGSVAKQAVDTQAAVVAQGAATIAADQAQVDYARVQLSYTTIKAPFGGRTGMRLVDVGNLVRASEATGIVVINQIDPVTLSFTLPEDQFTRVNAAITQNRSQPLRVQALDANQQVLAQGKLLLVNNQIDTASGTIQLKAEFANQDHQLWPGQYLSVRLLLGETRDALVIPAAAVQRGPDGTFVYVQAADGKVAVQPIQVARLQGEHAVIAAGLQVQQRVVVDGQSKLRAGATVIERHLSSETRAEKLSETRTEKSSETKANKANTASADEAVR